LRFCLTLANIIDEICDGSYASPMKFRPPEYRLYILFEH